MAEEQSLLMMMSEGVRIKFVAEHEKKMPNGDIRSVHMDWPVSYQMLLFIAERLFNVESVRFRYIDEDGDEITVSSQFELDCAFVKNGQYSSHLTLLTELLETKSNQRSFQFDCTNDYTLERLVQALEGAQQSVRKLNELGKAFCQIGERLIQRSHDGKQVLTISCECGPEPFHVPTALHTTDMEQYLLKELYDIGFANTEYNLRLLRQNSNDMDATIKHLLGECF